MAVIFLFFPIVIKDKITRVVYMLVAKEKKEAEVVMLILNPVPIGLSRKRRPNKRFQEPELGSRTRGSDLAL